MKTFWTPAKVKILRDRWNAGDSAEKIAAALGTSRGAVLGKVHRGEFAARPRPVVGAHILMAVQPDLKERARRAARKESLSMSEWIRAVMARALEQGAENRAA